MKKRRRRRVAASLKADANIVPISCPDCFGVLRLLHEGQHDHFVFVCQINHRYSIHSLIQAKEEQVERIMWSAHVMLKQMMTVYEHAFAKSDELLATDHKSIRRRMDEVRKQCLAIRTMIEASHAVE